MVKRKDLVKYAAEFVGTFFLMLSITFSLNGEFIRFAPLILSSTLMVMIYVFGNISRSHFNPLVTFGFWWRKQIDRHLITGYLCAQFLGSASAIALNFLFFIDSQDLIAVDLVKNPDYSVLKGMAAEAIGTFALFIVVMIVATTKELKGNSFYGFTIAVTVMLMAYSFGDFGTFAAFNPAVSFGLLLESKISLGTFFLSLLAQSIGAFLAASIFKLFYSPFERNNT
ncbi:MAG: aquaporin [Bacteroidota bacterium]